MTVNRSDLSLVGSSNALSAAAANTAFESMLTCLLQKWPDTEQLEGRLVKELCQSFEMSTAHASYLKAWLKNIFQTGNSKDIHSLEKKLKGFELIGIKNQYALLAACYVLSESKNQPSVYFYKEKLRFFCEKHPQFLRSEISSFSKDQISEKFWNSFERKPAYKIIGLAGLLLATMGGLYLAGAKADTGNVRVSQNSIPTKSSTVIFPPVEVSEAFYYPQFLLFNNPSSPVIELTIECERDSSFPEPEFLQVELLFETFMGENNYEKALEIALKQPLSTLKEMHFKNILTKILSEKILDSKFIFKIIQQMSLENQADAYKKTFNAFLNGNHLDEALDVIRLSSHHQPQNVENGYRLNSFIKYIVSTPVSKEKFDDIVDAIKESIERYSSGEDNQKECYSLLNRFLLETAETALKQNDPDAALRAFNQFSNDGDSQHYLSILSNLITDHYKKNNLYYEITLIAKDSEKLQHALIHGIYSFLESTHFSIEQKIEITSQMVETFSEQNSKYVCEQVTNFLVRKKEFRAFLNILEKSSLDSSMKNLFIINALTKADEIDPSIKKQLIDAIDLSIPECIYVETKQQYLKMLQKHLEKLQEEKDSVFCSVFKNLLKETDCEIGKLIEKWNLKEEIQKIKNITCYRKSSEASSSAEAPPLQGPGKSINCVSVPSSCLDATCETLDPTCEDHAKIILELGNRPFDIHEAKKQYRKISKRFHPDKTTLDKEVALKAFQRLNQVKEVFL